MKIIYESFDGKQFDNEFDCKDYEWIKNHEKGFKDIIFYDKNGNILDNKLSSDTYNNVESIRIKSFEGVQTIKAIADYTGFYCYNDVNSVGYWYWENTIAGFKKSDE